MPGPPTTPTGHLTAIPPAVTPLAGAARPSRAWSVSAEHGDIPATGVRTYDPDGATAGVFPAITADKLFPFTSAYGVYSGACKSANPQTLVPPTAPGFAKTPGGLAPGELLFPLAVRMPSLNVKVLNGVNPVLAGNVIVTPTSGDCATPTPQPKVQMKTWSNALVTDPNRGWATKQITPVNKVFDPGMPYGTYSVCADDGIKRKTTPSVVLNNNASGSIPITINLSSLTTNSRCAFL